MSALLLTALAAAAQAQTVLHATPGDFAVFEAVGLSTRTYETALWGLAPKGEGFEKYGELTSIPIEASFDELVPSWNARVPAGSKLSVFLQARQGKAWTRWYAMGESQAGSRRSVPGQTDDAAKVNVDTLELKAPAEAFRYRLVFEGDGTSGPELTLFAVAASSRSAEPPAEPAFSTGTWVRELEVVERSQKVEQPEYRSDICSPTSLSMAAAFWGVLRPTADWVKDVYDEAEKIYGNWPFNVQAAAEQGLESYVTRLGSMRELQDEIAEGRPVVVSLTFAEGELTGAPLKKTRGHLLVVRGFTAEGDVIVNDPAAPPDSVRRVYRRDEFRKVWLVNKRGLAYRIRPRFPKVLNVRETAWLGGREVLPDEPLLARIAKGSRVRASLITDFGLEPEEGEIEASALYERTVPAHPRHRFLLPEGPRTTTERQLKDLIGAPYRPGGASKQGLDGTGLVRNFYHQKGIVLPADPLRWSCPAVSEPRAGDVVVAKDRVALSLGGRRIIEVDARKGAREAKLPAAAKGQVKFLRCLP